MKIKLVIKMIIKKKKTIKLIRMNNKMIFRLFMMKTYQLKKGKFNGLLIINLNIVNFLLKQIKQLKNNNSLKELYVLEIIISKNMRNKKKLKLNSKMKNQKIIN